MRPIAIALTVGVLVGCSSGLTKPEAWQSRSGASFTRDSAGCKAEANKTNQTIFKGRVIYENCMISRGWDRSSD